MKWYEAQDTFVGDLENGASVRITKGQPVPENHELVKRDLDGAGLLFRLLDQGEPEEPPKGRSAPKARG